MESKGSIWRFGLSTAVLVATLWAGGCGSRSGPTTSATTTVAPATTQPAPIATTTRPPATTQPSATTTPVTTTAVPTPPATTRPTPPTTAGAAHAATVITRGPSTSRVIALTFDAGSDTGHADAILGYLEANRIPATFGITGKWAAANPGLLQRIARDGYLIVNHTWDHRSFTGVSTATAPLTATEMKAELASADRAIRQITGRSTQPWFRPPFGDRNPSVDAVVGAAGYRYELMWTTDSLGWKGLAPASVVARCLAQAGPGSIILMHVGSASTDAAALPSLVSALRGQGYGFVTAARMVP